MALYAAKDVEQLNTVSIFPRHAPGKVMSEDSDESDEGSSVSSDEPEYETDSHTDATVTQPEERLVTRSGCRIKAIIRMDL